MNKRIFIVDLLRSTSAIMVLITHSSQFIKTGLLSKILNILNTFFVSRLWNFTGVHPGVVIFIVLSGYLIHRPMFGKDINLLPNSFWKIYTKKRILRIMPVLIFCMSIGVITLLHIDNSFKFEFVSELKSFLIPFIFIDLDIPFGNPIIDTAITELFLYIIAYPYFLYFIKSKWVLIPSLIIYFINFIFLFTDFSKIDGYNTWLGRNIYCFQLIWIIGAYICEKQESIKTFFDSNKRFRALFLLLGIISIYFIPFFKFPGSYVITTLFFSIYVAIFIVLFKGIIIRFRALNLISDRVYSIYAIHFPILLTFNFYNNSNFPISNSIFVIILLVIIEIVYRLIEKPSHLLAKSIK